MRARDVKQKRVAGVEAARMALLPDGCVRLLSVCVDIPSQINSIFILNDSTQFDEHLSNLLRWMCAFTYAFISTNSNL